MNLEGKIVQFNLPADDWTNNNGLPTCPAIVLNDNNPDADLKHKQLNLYVLLDNIHHFYVRKTSVLHKSQIDSKPDNTAYWEEYKDSGNKDNEYLDSLPLITDSIKQRLNAIEQREKEREEEFQIMMKNFEKAALLEEKSTEKTTVKKNKK